MRITYYAGGDEAELPKHSQLRFYSDPENPDVCVTVSLAPREGVRVGNNAHPGSVNVRPMQDAIWVTSKVFD